MVAVSAQAQRDPRSAAIAAWAVGGVALLLGQAIVRLVPRALEPWIAVLDGGSVEPAVILAYLGAMAGLAYFEGYRGFQQRFSPRVVVRAQHLVRHPTALTVVLAPLMVMGLIHATRRRLIGSWGLIVGIIGLIVAVAQLDQPWRGAIDAGVVVGLSWGLIATLALAFRGARGQIPDVDPDLPKSPDPA